MSYFLNGTDLSTFGIIAGQAPGSNIALEGFLDFPERINITEHSWGDRNGVEPFVAEPEIHFGGRDINFYGFVKQPDRNSAISSLFGFYDFIDGFTDLVPLVTPRGTFNVMISGEIEVAYFNQGLCRLKIPFREPIPDLSGGTIPVTEDPENISGISGIDFVDLGFQVVDFSGMGIRSSTLKGLLERPSPKSQDAIDYFNEAFQVTKVGAREYSLNGLIIKSTWSALEQTVKNLYAVFKEPGTRIIYLPGDLVRVVYLKNGFKVSGIRVRTGQVYAKLEINFTEAEEATENENYLLLGDTVNRYVTTTLGQKILVKI